MKALSIWFSLFLLVFMAPISGFASDSLCEEFFYQRFEITYRHPGNFIGDPDNMMFLEFDDNRGFNYSSSLSGFGSIDPNRNEVGVQKMWLGFNTHQKFYSSCDNNQMQCLKSLERILKDLSRDFLSNIKKGQEEFKEKEMAIKCAIFFTESYQSRLRSK